MGVGILHMRQRCHLALNSHAGLLSPRGSLVPTQKEGTVIILQLHRLPQCQHCDTVSCLSPLGLGEVWGSPSLSLHDKGGARSFDENPALPSPGSSCCFGKEGLSAELIKKEAF